MAVRLCWSGVVGSEYRRSVGLSRSLSMPPATTAAASAIARQSSPSLQTNTTGFTVFSIIVAYCRRYAFPAKSRGIPIDITNPSSGRASTSFTHAFRSARVNWRRSPVRGSR